MVNRFASTAFFYAAVGFGLAALAYFAVHTPPAAEVQVRTRKVGFDNLYGSVASVVVQFKLDDRAEQTVMATCDTSTCIFELPLTNESHNLELSVVQNGQRSATTRVTLDTSTLP